MKKEVEQLGQGFTMCLVSGDEILLPTYLVKQLRQFNPGEDISQACGLSFGVLEYFLSCLRDAEHAVDHGV